MRNKTFIALFTALLAVMFIVTGCSGPEYPGSVIPQGKGSLNLTVRGVGGRTILPKEMTYILVATPTAGDPTSDIILYAGSNTIYLDVGTYSLTLTASLDGVAIARGSISNVVITANAVTQKTITLASISGGGGSNGTFAWDLSAFEEATTVNIKISSLDEDFYDLGDFNDGEKTWFSDGTDNEDTDLTMEILQGAKYLILGYDSESKGGFGGVQIAANGDIDGWDWHDCLVSGDWNEPTFLDWSTNIPFYIVVDLASFSGFSTVAKGEKAKLVLNGGPADMTLTSAWLTNAVLGPFDDDNKFSNQGTCWAVEDFPATFSDSITIDETTIVGDVELAAGTYLVEFEVDSVKWQEILWISTGFTSEYKPPFGNEAGFEEPGDALDDLVFAQIAAGKYSELLGTDFGLLSTPIDGVSAANIGDIRTAMKLILDTVGNDAPTDFAELAEFIDAALVAAGAPTVNPDDSLKDTLIEAFPANGTSVSNIDWDNWTDDYSVEIIVGAYTFTVIILPEPEYIEELTLAESYAVYKFDTQGEPFENYTSIKVNYKMDADNLALSTRSVRLHGDYSNVLASFTVPTEGEVPVFAFDTSNAAYIYDDIGTGALTTAGAAADKWFTLTYRLLIDPDTPATPGPEYAHPNAGAGFANKPADAATGPFYFGIGIPGGSAGSASTPKKQQVKNITLVHKTDSTKNVVTNDFYGFVGKLDTTANPTGWSLASKREMAYNPSYSGPISPFNIDVSKIVSGQASNPFSSTPATVPAGDGVTVTFTVENQGVGFALDNVQIAKVKASSKVVVTLKATSDPDTAVYRGCLGNITLGSGWNNTDMYLNGAALSTIYDDPQTVNVNSKGDNTLLHFILQTRSTFVAADVTFESIYIECIR